MKKLNYDEIVNKVTNIGHAFDVNWNEHYSVSPEVALLSYEERLKWKEFTWKIVADLHSNLHKDIEKLLDDTRDKVIDEIKDAIDVM